MPAKDENEEREQLIEALRRHHFDKHKVAEEFTITLKSVYARMKRLGIPGRKALLRKQLEEKG